MAKIQLLLNKSDSKRFHNEVKATETASDQKLGAKLYDFFLCEPAQMKWYQNFVPDQVVPYHSSDIHINFCDMHKIENNLKYGIMILQKIIPVPASLLVKNFYTLIIPSIKITLRNMFKSNLIHYDLTMKNILFENVGTTHRPLYVMYLIDWGLSETRKLGNEEREDFMTDFIWDLHQNLTRRQPLKRKL